MKFRLVWALVALLIPAGLSAQIIQPANPATQKPTNLPSVESVQKEIDAARGMRGASIPGGDFLKRVAGRVDGQPITVDDVLDELMMKYGSPLVAPLANQAFIELEVMKRGVEVTDAEFLREVRYYKAQASGEKTLAQALTDARMGWDRFERSIRTKAAVNKLVKSDQGVKDEGPPNPFLLQIWAGAIRKHYVMETNPEKLPAGCLAEVKTTWGFADVLEHMKAARNAGRPYRVEAEPGKQLVFVPADGGWPRFFVPNVTAKVTRLSGGETITVEMSAEEVTRGVVDGSGEIREHVVIFPKDAKVPSLLLPAVMVTRVAKKGQPAERTHLLDAVNAVLTQGYKVDREARRIAPADAEYPCFVLPEDTCATFQPPFRSSLVDLVAGVAATPSTAASQLLLTRKGDPGLVFLPAVPVSMVSRVDRGTVLGVAFGSMKLAQFENALESRALFTAIKRAFAGFLPGQPADAKASATWGVITVDEKAVAARIATERKKYDGTIFPWEMICQILGKTVPEEMRRFWVANGVDQVIGAEVTEEQLKEYFDKDVQNFGVATVEASHILIRMPDPKTGRIDWEVARKQAEKVLAMIRTGADFGAMAEKYSEDPATKDKDGDLGLFTVVSRYDIDLCRAAFAMEPGELSAEPVKTSLGYHILLVRKKSPPDLTQYGWDSEGMKDKVREAWMEEREAAWIAANIEGKYRLENDVEKAFE